MEVSHKSMFNLWPLKEVHWISVNITVMSFYLFCIYCEKSVNQCTSSAILAVKHWASRNGLPCKIISDTGGAFRDEFIQQLHEMGVNQHPSSAFHCKSNSLTERAFHSLKDVKLFLQLMHTCLLKGQEVIMIVF